MFKGRKIKKQKLRTPGYFESDSEDDTRGSTIPIRRLEEVDSYSKIGDKLNMSSTVIETTCSPRRSSTVSKPSDYGRTGRGTKRPRNDRDEGDDSGDDEDDDGGMDLGGISFLVDETRPPGRPAVGQKGKQSRAKRPPQKSALLEFTPQLDKFLDEMLRSEGLGDSLDCSTCMQCQINIATQKDAAYRCLDCNPSALWCRDCCVSSHAQSYLHRTQVWTGGCFERASLRDLGLRVQLGHTAGTVCPHRAETGVEFVVIDSDEIHVVNLDYCQCHRGVDPIQQLLRARLLPATVQSPKTAATFRVLETFQMLSFTGKVSAYEFLMAVQRRTDNATTHSVKQRNREWMRIIHLFRHLRMMKRGGRGHAAEGVGGTKEGELALLCPACPQGNINMPMDWESLPEDQLWVHALFLAIDANFRLKRKCSSSDENDPGLNHGFAYIVAEALYKAFLRENEKKVGEEKSNCSNHDAIKSAQIRRGKGEKAATGLGACQCARHDMKRPCGAGDLQKGERYINIDYVVLSTLRFSIILLLVISYDIACQWSRNLPARCRLYPPNPISKNPNAKTTFCVPKFHAPAHVVPCRVNYSFNLTPRVGRTDGEAPERGWSAADQIATSTREMGPGNRRDTLDDFLGFINWEKSVAMAETVGDRGRVAAVMSVKQGNAFKGFGSSIPQLCRVGFTEKVIAWEKDRSLPNPHESPEIKVDVRKTRLRLGKEDEDAIAGGLVERVHEDMTGSLFVLEGIEIEEAQRRVELECKKLGPHSTDLDRSKAQEHKNSLQRKLKNFIELRRLFLPSTFFVEREGSNGEPGDASGESAYRGSTEDDGEDEEDPWEVRLDLPSELLSENRKCDRRFVRYEFLFRISQAHTTLKELRAQLLQQDHMVLSKKKYTHGTAMLTMSNALLQDVGSRIKEEKRRYRAIHVRLLALWAFLEGAGSLDDVKDQLRWRETLKELKTGDACGLTCLDGDKLGEGSKTLAWIWQVGADAEEMANISLRVEFCKSRARAHRWQEECLLLAEEMRRIERFWIWDARRWQERAASQPAVAEQRLQGQIAKDEAAGIVRSPLTAFQEQDRRSITHGKIAYAIRQARIRVRILQEARSQMAGLPALLESGPPLIECTGADDAPPELLPIPRVPPKPIRVGGRAHRSRNDGPEPQTAKSTVAREPGDSDEEYEEDPFTGASEVAPAGPGVGEVEEDPGKTYDGTDDES